MKNEFSKNAKLEKLLQEIKSQLLEMGIEEVKRYHNEFKWELDYNIVNYGNLLIYYDDIRELYNSCGYKTFNALSDNKVWKTYQRQVGYVARYLLK